MGEHAPAAGTSLGKAVSLRELRWCTEVSWDYTVPTSKEENMAITSHGNTLCYLRMSQSLAVLSYDPETSWWSLTGDHVTARTHFLCDERVPLTTAVAVGGREF